MTLQVQENSAVNDQSAEDAVYLRDDVKLEPLIYRWYAWSHLMSPAQLALHLKFRILPLLTSFVASPTVHIAANADPKMYGGPFMSLAESDVPAIARLVEETSSGAAALLALAQDLKDVSTSLQEKANGYSMNDFYATLPPSLQGLIEFLYTTNHQPDIRLFEGLMDAQDYLDDAQEIMLEARAERDRHFFMSTPRLDTSESLSFKMPFADQRLDELAAMRKRPASFAAIAKAFEVEDKDLATFRNLFTETAPALPTRTDPVSGDQVRVRFFGHACVLFETKDVTVLFDPFVAIESKADNRFTMNDLPDFIDYVVLTHHHHDHFNPEMLLQLRHRIGRVIVPQNNSGALADPSMKLALRKLGFTNVDMINPFDQVDLPDGRIMSLPFTGEHADLNIYSKQAIALKLHDRQFLFLIDSDGRDLFLYKRIMERIGKIDALFIGMECHGAPLNWLYEPLLFKPVSRRNNESRRLSGADCERAWGIVNQVQAPQVYVYAMGQDPWMKYVMGLEYEADSIQLVESERLLERAKAAGIPATRLVSGYEARY